MYSRRISWSGFDFSGQGQQVMASYNPVTLVPVGTPSVGEVLGGCDGYLQYFGLGWSQMISQRADGWHRRPSQVGELSCTH